MSELRAAKIDAAGQAYGYKEKQSSSPWTVIVKLDGKIVDANTKSTAATLDVDADGDGKADARVQIGPVMRGTALRDSLDFVPSTSSPTRSTLPSSARPSISMSTRR